MPISKFDGPIPGENFTSNTKNYPWHRPPEFKDLDKAIEYIGKRLTTEEHAFSILTMLEGGVSVVDVTQMFLMSGVGAGKWTLDYALMLAGPTAHTISILAKAYGMKPELGIDSKIRMPSKSLFDAVSSINRGKAAAAGRTAADALDDIQDDTSKVMKQGAIEKKAPTPKFAGFMGMGEETEDTQEDMLGQGGSTATDTPETETGVV